MAEIDRVAWHESAHAVVTVKLGHGIDHVELLRDADGSWSGHCTGIDAPHTPRLFVDRITITVAGGEGEIIKFGEAWGGKGDRQRAAELLDELRRLTGRDHDVEWFERRARALLIENWSAVRLVARGLIQNHRVESPQLQRWVSYAL